MPWKRGNCSVEVELANVQGWIEDADPKLNGNGRPGLFETVSEWKGQIRLVTALVILFGALSSIGMLILGLLEYNRQVQQHMLIPPALGHHEEPQNATNEGVDSARP
jgi:hypothetical protein